jgi:hypothetical protein
MQRRQFITVFVGAVLWPLAAHVQQRRCARSVANERNFGDH